MEIKIGIIGGRHDKKPLNEMMQAGIDDSLPVVTIKDDNHLPTIQSLEDSLIKGPFDGCGVKDYHTSMSSDDNGRVKKHPHSRHKGYNNK